MNLLTGEQLQNEPAHIYNCDIAFDSNTSMKQFYRLGSTHPRDLLPFLSSDYLIPPKYVDRFKDKICSSRGPAIPQCEGNVGDAGEDNDDYAGDIGGGSMTVLRTERPLHHAEKKRMWGISRRQGSL